MTNANSIFQIIEIMFLRNCINCHSVEKQLILFCSFCDVKVSMLPNRMMTPAIFLIQLGLDSVEVAFLAPCWISSEHWNFLRPVFQRQTLTLSGKIDVCYIVNGMCPHYIGKSQWQNVSKQLNPTMGSTNFLKRIRFGSLWQMPTICYITP